MRKSFFSMSAAMLSSLGIPVCYDGESDFAAVFGDDALYFENKHKKVLLDLPAALLLQKQGIDVGITSVAKAERPFTEHFGNERVLLSWIDAKAEFNSLSLKDGATVSSRYNTGDVASFEYNSFFVVNFDASKVGENSSLFCSYARGEQLRKFFGDPYPAIRNFADIYSICAKTENGHAVLFQNLSPDPVFDFDIQLPKNCKAFKLYNAKGALDGDRIHITTEFSPSASIVLEIEYEK